MRSQECTGTLGLLLLVSGRLNSQHGTLCTGAGLSFVYIYNVFARLQ